MYVKVYYTSFSRCLNDGQYAAYLDTFPQKMQERMVRFARWQDRHAALLGKLLLRKGLMEMGFHRSFENLKYTDYSRPYFDNCSIDFNISHSGEYVLCALGNALKLGIDIEHIRPLDLCHFNSQWTAQELVNIRHSKNDLKQFFNYWTRKESVVKANGKGLSLPLNEIDVTADNILVENKTWHIKEIYISDAYSVHLATDVFLRDLEIERLDFTRKDLAV
jgi:4'-phosphopantetheinyl transferase